MIQLPYTIVEALVSNSRTHKLATHLATDMGEPACKSKFRLKKFKISHSTEVTCTHCKRLLIAIHKAEKTAPYIIPEWCNMHPLEHFDGVGGCWGILFGHVLEEGIHYCQECEYLRILK